MFGTSVSSKLEDTVPKFSPVLFYSWIDYIPPSRLLSLITKNIRTSKYFCLDIIIYGFLRSHSLVSRTPKSSSVARRLALGATPQYFKIS